MPDDKDITIQTPGEVPAVEAEESSDPRDVRIVELEGVVAQLGAALSDAQEQIRTLQSVPSPVTRVETGPRLIGEDWSSKTTAEAKLAGVSHTVLCSDGYYVPG